METIAAGLKWGVGTFENVSGTTDGVPTFKLSQIAIGDGEFAYYNLDYVATLNQYGAQDKYYSWDPYSDDGGCWVTTDEVGTLGDPAWYMVNSGSVEAKAGTTKAPLANLDLIVGGGTSGEHTTWQSVPEPTSGLLLLLGVAGLALRHRRA